jgi:hypothetical protein
MKSASIVKASLVGFLASALIAIGATPASATPPPRPLPVNQILYSVACDLTYNASLTSVLPTTGVASVIGTGVGGDNCGGAAAWDALTQTAYYFGTNSDDLYSINLSTGVATDLGQFHAGVNQIFATAIMIGADGDAYIIDGPNDVYSVDLATAAVTLIGSMGDPLPSYYAAAFDPADGKYYALDSVGNLGTIDVATGAFTVVGVLGAVPAAQGSWALQFDANGTLWVEQDGSGQNQSDLWSYLPTDLAASGIDSGDIAVAGTDIYTNSLLIPTQAEVTISAQSVAVGGKVTVTGSGFTAGETVSVVLDGSSPAITTLTASDTGMVSATITIPDTTTDGAHTLSLVGSVSGIATAGFTATPALATTGVDAQTPLELGGILLALGIGFILVRRVTTLRKRANS